MKDLVNIDKQAEVEAFSGLWDYGRHVADIRYPEFVTADASRIRDDLYLVRTVDRDSFIEEANRARQIGRLLHGLMIDGFTEVFFMAEQTIDKNTVLQDGSSLRESFFLLENNLVNNCRAVVVYDPDCDQLSVEVANARDVESDLIRTNYKGAFQENHHMLVVGYRRYDFELYSQDDDLTAGNSAIVSLRLRLSNAIVRMNGKIRR